MSIFPLYALTAILLWVPFGVFITAIVIIALACFRFWRRERLRIALAVVGLLVTLLAIPSAAVQLSFGMAANERVESGFGVAIAPDRVAKYRFTLAGLGDTMEFWKLKNTDGSNCMTIVSKNGLTMRSSERLLPPGSVEDGPWWWPNSTQGYSVFEGEDTEGGTMEVWIPRNGTSAYLYRFLE